MKEIIIEGKKYIPSKQAAKLTGYAKDYVGQLCREGRVPARLVGRSWYVLESAIKDHRFGNKEKDTKKTKHAIKDEPHTKKDEVSIIDSWGDTQYKTSEIETLPTLQKDSTEDSQEKKRDNLHSVWGEWFEHVASDESTEHVEKKEIDRVTVGEDIVTEDEPPLIETIVPADMNMLEPSKSDKYSEESNSTPVPLHLIKNTSNDGIPQTAHEEETRVAMAGKYSLNKYTAAFQVVAVIIATVSVLLAVLGSGYMDTYLISFNPVSNISGITVYNK